MISILNIPYLFRILVTLGLIIVTYKLAKNLLLSLLVGTTILVLWTGHNLQSAWTIVIQTCAQLDFLLLMLTVLLIIFLSSVMSESGMMKEMITVVKSRLSFRASLAVLPAIIGLLPMPGGALFSAPLVDECDEDKHLDPLLKTRINYWFRHIWEYWWPLYPGVLTAMGISKLPPAQFVAIQIPLCLFAIVGGYLFLLRPIKATHAKGRFIPGQILPIFMPIILIVAVYVIIRVCLPGLFNLSPYLPILIGLVGALLYLQLTYKLAVSSWLKIMFNSKSYELLLIVGIILIYSGFMRAELADGQSLIAHIKAELDAFGIPVFLVIMLLPFISGISTGVAIGFVGLSLPVALSLVDVSGGMSGKYLATIVLAYGFGYMGMMLSPVHVCLIVTNRYFNTTLGKSLLELIVPAAFVLACVFLYSWLLSIF